MIGPQGRHPVNATAQPNVLERSARASTHLSTTSLQRTPPGVHSDSTKIETFENKSTERYEDSVSSQGLSRDRSETSPELNIDPYQQALLAIELHEKKLRLDDDFDTMAWMITHQRLLATAQQLRPKQKLRDGLTYEGALEDIAKHEKELQKIVDNDDKNDPIATLDAMDRWCETNKLLQHAAEQLRPKDDLRDCNSVTDGTAKPSYPFSVRMKVERPLAHLAADEVRTHGGLVEPDKGVREEEEEQFSTSAFLLLPHFHTAATEICTFISDVLTCKRRKQNDQLFTIPHHDVLSLTNFLTLKHACIEESVIPKQKTALRSDFRLLYDAVTTRSSS